MTTNPTTTTATRTDGSRSPLTGTKTGTVVSDKRSKTRTVEVRFLSQDTKYGKYRKHKSRYQVHDPENDSVHGDLVEIANCRPVSKTKSWRLVRVVDRAVGSEHRDVEA